MTIRSAALNTLFAATLLSTSCKTLEVTRINSEEKSPNNVWVFFTVEKSGEPVPSLTADDFEIYEDSQRVSTFESKQVILNPDVAAVMYTMLLLDMSGSVTESGEADRLVDAAHHSPSASANRKKSRFTHSTAAKTSNLSYASPKPRAALTAAWMAYEPTNPKIPRPTSMAR